MPPSAKATFNRKLKALKARQEKLAEAASELAAAEIERLLGELNARFKNHHFDFMQGMGSTVIYCDRGVPFDIDLSIAPGARGGWYWYNADHEGRFRKIGDFIRERHNRIMEIADDVEETFNVALGDIG